MSSTEDPDHELWTKVERTLEHEDSLVEGFAALLECSLEPIARVCAGFRIEVGPGSFNLDLVQRSVLSRAFETALAMLSLLRTGHGATSRTFLRQLIEDLIFTQWLKTLDENDANAYLVASCGVDLAESIESQKAFLGWLYPLLDVDDYNDALGMRLEVPPSALAQDKQVLSYLRTKYEWRSWRGPSVKQMAVAANLDREYDFIYKLASKAVHANVHEILRGMRVDRRTMKTTAGQSYLQPIHKHAALVYGTWTFSQLVESMSESYSTLETLVGSKDWSVWHAILLHPIAVHKQLPPLVADVEVRPWQKVATPGTPSM